jgi:PKHD-type hydroxylase
MRWRQTIRLIGTLNGTGTNLIQFTKYGVGQFYGWHSDAFATPYKMDMGEWSGKIRKLSVTINLSDPKDYKGGNLRFDFGPHAQKKRFHTCTEIRPRGSIIVFPSHMFPPSDPRYKRHKALACHVEFGISLEIMK